MTLLSKEFKLRDVLPRMLADYVIVHLAAILSLVGTLGFYLFNTTLVRRDFLVAVLRHDYLDQFVLMTVCFPSVFLLFGFYTRSRAYAQRYKWFVLFRGCLLASLVYLFTSVIVSGRSILPRSSLLFLPVLVTTGVIGIRWLNLWLEQEHLSTMPGRHSASATADAPILVVGGAGYIGVLVLRKLLQRGCSVRLLDNLTYGEEPVGKLLSNPRLDFIKGDCRNIQDVSRAMSGVKTVIHLAAVVGDPACAMDDKNALEINYAATRMMLEIAKGHGIQRFIFASSCSVYGASDFLMDEHSETAPISLYARTKLNSEKILLDAATPNFHPVILRFSTVFGLAPRPRFDLVVNLLTAKAYKEGVITIFNGEQWRPFIHVDDVAEAACQVLDAPASLVSSEIFNVGDDRLNYTLTQVADEIKRQFPDTRIEHTENADRRNYRVSFSKIRERIGFECQKSLEQGIQEIRLAFETGQITTYLDPLYSNQAYLKIHGGIDSESEMDGRVMAAFAGSEHGNR